MRRARNRSFGGMMDRVGNILSRSMGHDAEYAGIHIGDTRIRAVRMDHPAGRWRIRRWASVAPAPDTLRYAYKRSTVLNSESLVASLREAISQIGGDFHRVALAIPNEVVKVMIQPFKELPAGRANILKMIHWWAEKTLKVPADKALADYHILENAPKGEKRLLITIGYREVIREYEVHAGALGIEPVVVSPAAIHQLNFYGGELPDQGVCAFLGMFETYFALTVMEDGVPFFHQGMKIAPTDDNFVYHVDAALQYQQELHPDRVISRLYMNYPGKCYRDLEQSLTEILQSRPVLMDERRIIGTGLASGENQLTGYGGEWGTTQALSAFAPAAGAAMSLARSFRNAIS